MPHILSKRNKKIGLYWLLASTIAFTSIFVILVLFSVTNTIISSGRFSGAYQWLSIINFAYTTLGLIAVITIPIGIIMWIIYSLRRESAHAGAIFDERSGNGDASIIPAEIQKWNWGAAGLTWIWGAYHDVWIALLAIIPVLNIVMLIVLGLKGSDWAWQANKWKNVEEFAAMQKKWEPWGIAFFVLTILGTIGQMYRMM